MVVEICRRCVSGSAGCAVGGVVSGVTVGLCCLLGCSVAVDGGVEEGRFGSWFIALFSRVVALTLGSGRRWATVLVAVSVIKCRWNWSLVMVSYPSRPRS